MRLTVELKKLARTPLVILDAAVFLLCLFQITLSIGSLMVGLIYALPFAVLTTLIVHCIYLALLLPGCSLKDEYEFTPEKLTQRRKGRTLKEISLGYGLYVYRYAGILRTTLVFSRRQLPQGELLKAYKKDAEVIYIPYFPRKMPRLKKYVDKSTRI